MDDRNFAFACGLDRASDKTTSGLYVTADDFTNGKLTYEGREGESYKLQLHHARPYLDVRHGNEMEPKVTDHPR